jgi:hypothetical protein
MRRRIDRAAGQKVGDADFGHGPAMVSVGL